MASRRRCSPTVQQMRSLRRSWRKTRESTASRSKKGSAGRSKPHEQRPGLSMSSLRRIRRWVESQTKPHPFQGLRELQRELNLARTKQVDSLPIIHRGNVLAEVARLLKNRTVVAITLKLAPPEPTMLPFRIALPKAIPSLTTPRQKRRARSAGSRSRRG